MKKLFYLRTLCAAVISSVTALVLTSCGSDEPVKNNTLLTVVVPPGSLKPDQDVWYFLTDQEGTLLDIQEAVDGLDMVFTRPEGFTGKTFSVHHVVYDFGDDYADFNIMSYTNITKGEINPPAEPTETGSVVGLHHFDVSDVPTGYMPQVVGPNQQGGSFQGINGDFTGATSMLQNNIPLLYWIKDGSNRTRVPRYRFVSNASAGETVTEAFNDLPLASERVFNFGTSVDRVDVTIMPYFPNMYTSYFENFIQTNVTSTTLYHPADAYDLYSTRIAVTDGDQSNTYHTVGPIPASIKTISATINSLSVEDDELTVGTTGSFDYMHVRSFTEWQTDEIEHWLTWNVYMDDEPLKTFTIPAFPPVLLERYPELLVAEKNFSNVYVYENSSLNGYDQYIQSAWRMTSFPEFTENLIRRKAFNTSGRIPEAEEARKPK